MNFRDPKEEAESKAQMNLHYTAQGQAVFSSKADDQASAQALLAKFSKNDKVCPRCDCKNLSSTSVTDGCRMSGDAYGRYITSCPQCSWRHEQVWDEY